MESVCIVGGGGAGMITALTLQERVPGLSVTVMEREPEAYTTLCAEGISERTLDRFTAFDARPHCAQAFAGARWWFPGDVEVLVNERCFTIERASWIPAMAKAFKDRGGTFRGGEKVYPEDVEELRDGFDVVVGADGPGSNVRDAIGGEATTRLGVQVRLQATWEGDRLEFYTHKAFSPEYAWVFPKGDILNVGILGEQDGEDFERIEAFREWIGLTDGKVVKREAYPIAFHGSKVAEGNVALVGDAAGLTNPLTKGGMAAIIHSAELLAKAVNEARGSGLDGDAAARAYGERVRDHPVADPIYQEALDVMLSWSNDDFERVARFAPGSIVAGGGSLASKALLGLGAISSPSRARELFTMYRAMALSKEYSW